MEKGLQEGRTKLLQEMIQKKYRKGKLAEEIAEELEITEDTVKKFLDGVV